MNRKSQQSDYIPTGRSAFLTSLVVLLILFSAYCYFSLHRSQASGGKMAAASDPQTPTAEDHYINIPYFSESGGMSSTLTLNNNESEPMTASVTIFGKKGDQITVPPITLQPTLATRFRLKDLIGNAGEDFSSGNIQVFYQGSLMGITSQVSIVSANHHLAFESVETEAMDFASTTLNGIAWIPDNETKAKLALTNTTSAPLDITATGNEKVQSITLKARETRVIDLEDYLGDSHATLVTLNHHGPLGALIATGFALNEETGFSTNLNFVDCATAKASRLAAAHVRFGQADPQEGFPSGTNFRAPLAIANTMDMPTEARISITYTLDSVTNTVQLKPVTLAAREVKLIELAKQMARLGVSGPVEDAGVDITYTHMPGTVIGRLTSYDASGDYSFDVPVKDPSDQGNGGYPWRLDNGYTTVVHLKNTLDKEVTAVVQLRYEGGSYNPDRIKLAAYQTVAIDIRKLRDAQQKDIRGGVMPKDIENGQVAWFEEEVGSLIGRAEVANLEAAVASSFSCGECGCGPLVMDSCYMTPSSGKALEGVTGYMFAPQVMKRDCHYVQYGPYSPSSPIDWSSTNTPVVTVDGAGNETTVAPGSGTILARWQEVVGANYSCAAIYAYVTASATCDVDTLRALVPNPPVEEVDGSPGVIAGQSFSIVLQAINSSGDLDLIFEGAVSVSRSRTLDSSEIDLPSSVTLHGGGYAQSMMLNRVNGAERGTTFGFTPAGGGKVLLFLYTYFNPIASIEGGIGGTTSCGHMYASGDHFVALPADKTVICNLAVVVRNGALSDTTIALESGPWFPHSVATSGNPCVGPDDPYWNTGGVPRVEDPSVTCDQPVGASAQSNAGIDLANGTASTLGISGNTRVLWRFN